ncbi:MAG TPA: (d)CMP kinase [Longimicrobiales bacterium]|nr:(d)CMP kinase [Longimicrobiales bacterium]
MIIAIDGPAGSGKSSTAKAVARRLGFRHLDSGAFYRTITLAALQRSIPVEKWHDLDADELSSWRVSASPSAQGFAFSIGGDDVTNEIRSPEVNAHVSQMAAVPAVRTWLMDQLRAAGASTSLVADGRDIGTVVFPRADLKVFLVADPEVRARRRLAENGMSAPSSEELRREVERLLQRDRIDSERAIAPLRQAEDAILLDTSTLTFEQQVGRIVELAQDRRAVRGK